MKQVKFYEMAAFRHNGRITLSQIQRLDQKGIHYLEVASLKEGTPAPRWLRSSKWTVRESHLAVEIRMNGSEQTLPPGWDQMNVHTITLAYQRAPGSWDKHRQRLKTLASWVEQLTQQGFEVIVKFTQAMSWMRENQEALEDQIRTALHSGAQWVVLCDEGSALPWEVATMFAELTQKFPAHRLGFCSLNTMDCADDNAVAVLRQGAHLIMGTYNGTGQGMGCTSLAYVASYLAREEQSSPWPETTWNALLDVIWA